MGKVLKDFGAWLVDSEIKTEEEYEFLYRRLKIRMWVYLLLSFVTLPIIIGAFIYPFFFKAYYLQKVFKYKDFNVKVSIFWSLLLMLSFITLIPIVLVPIINHTNLGMGINNWQKAYDKYRVKKELKAN